LERKAKKAALEEADAKQEALAAPVNEEDMTEEEK